MPLKLPPHEMTRIYHLLLAPNASCEAVAEQCGVSARSVRRWKKDWQLFGAPYPPKLTKQGRPRLLTEEQELHVIEFINERPTSYMDEAAWWIFDEFGVVVSHWMLYKMMERRGWSDKDVKRVAAERSSQLRSIWCARRLHWCVEDLVFVDESAANEASAHRKRGWSPVGQPCHDVKLLKRSERWSILPALTLNGYLEGTLIVQGSVTGEMFEEWLQSVVLPQCQPGSILVMDNASIHRTARVKSLCEEHNVFLEYLPPYSPDLNPIEQSFHSLKESLRRHQDDVLLYPSFGEFLRARVEEVVGLSARKFFELSGYL